jgi:hypothetical protein
MGVTELCIKKGEDAKVYFRVFKIVRLLEDSRWQLEGGSRQHGSINQKSC